MNKVPQEIKVLVRKLHDNIITEEEFEALQLWYDSFDDSEVVVNSPEDEAVLNERIMARLNREVLSDSIRNSNPYFTLKNIIAAAAILLICSVGVYFINTKIQVATEDLTTEQLALENRPSPSNGALITLFNNEEVDLAGRTDFHVAELDQAIDSIEDLAVIANQQPLEEEDLYQLFVPKGKLFEMVLEDGTRVWLNADTKLDFPRKFNGTNRTVHLEGEAYFSVVKDGSRPFVVKTRQQSIQVLGTKFNVNSYPEQEAELTTLYEGSVEITNRETANKSILLPGEEAHVKGSFTTKMSNSETNLAEWKDKVFVFENESLKSVLMKISRWYDVDISDLTDLPNNKLSGKIRTEADLFETLEIINLASGITFQVQKNKIIKK